MAKLIVAFYVLATSAGLVALKLGTKTGLPIGYNNHKLVFNLNFYSVSGISLYITSFILYMYLISKNDLGYIIPLTTALVYIVIFAASFIIFKESFTITKTIGILLITIGLVLLNLKK